jgi:hypothetical protein
MSDHRQATADPLATILEKLSASKDGLVARWAQRLLGCESQKGENTPRAAGGDSISIAPNATARG